MVAQDLIFFEDMIIFELTNVEIIELLREKLLASLKSLELGRPWIEVKLYEDNS